MAKKINPNDMRYWQNRKWLRSYDIPKNLINYGNLLLDNENKLFEKILIDDLNETIAEAFAANLQDSYAIENEYLNSSYIKSSIIKRMNLDLPGWTPKIKERDREKRATQMTLTLLNTKELTNEMICEAHGMLNDSYNFGRYRISDEVIMDELNKQIVYYAPEPYLLKDQMNEFIDWWNDDRKNLPNQIGAAIGHYIFVVIHPFGDGNGRIARALAEKGMIIDRDKIFRPYSLSSQILKNKGQYYQALESNDFLAFPRFMLNMHSQALDDGFYKAGRLNFLKFFFNRGNFADNEKAIIKIIALNNKKIWSVNDFNQIEKYQDAWDNLKIKNIIDENGFLNEDWRLDTTNNQNIDNNYQKMNL